MSGKCDNGSCCYVYDSNNENYCVNCGPRTVTAPTVEPAGVRLADRTFDTLCQRLMIDEQVMRNHEHATLSKGEVRTIIAARQQLAELQREKAAAIGLQEGTALVVKQLEQQLAEMRGRWVPWKHGDALPATAPVLHWTTWFDKEYTDVPMMRANHAHDFERWGVIAYWSIPLPPAHDATRGKCETCSVSGRLFESTVVPEDTEIPCPDCAQPSRGKCEKCGHPITQRPQIASLTCQKCGWHRDEPDCAQPERQGVDWLELKAAVFTLRRHNHQAAAAALEHAIATLNAPTSPPPTDDIATLAMLESVQRQPQAFSPESLREIARRAIAALKGDK